MKIIRVCMDVEVSDAEFRYQSKYMSRDPKFWDWEDVLESSARVKSVYSAEIMEFEQPALDTKTETE